MKPLLLLLSVFASIILQNVKSSKILVITTLPAHSHFTIAFRLAEELADRSHQVTFMSPYPQKISKQNLLDISLEETIPFVDGKIFVFNIIKLVLVSVDISRN